MVDVDCVTGAPGILVPVTVAVECTAGGFVWMGAVSVDGGSSLLQKWCQFILEVNPPHPQPSDISLLAPSMPYFLFQCQRQIYCLKGMRRLLKKWSNQVII